MPKIGFPEFKQYGVQVFVGGCVARGDRSSFRAIAHSHNVLGKRRTNKWYGWICVRSPKRLRNEKGEPSATMWHELAHILTPNHWHDDVWRKKMIELGQPIERRYQKRKRIFYRCTRCKRRVIERSMRASLRAGGHTVTYWVKVNDDHRLWHFPMHSPRIKVGDWCNSKGWAKENGAKMGSRF
jgi:hypothetical protein